MCLCEPLCVVVSEFRVNVHSHVVTMRMLSVCVCMCLCVLQEAWNNLTLAAHYFNKPPLASS